MAEITPQVTYSPEGILEFNVGIIDEFKYEDVEPEIIDKLRERNTDLIKKVGEGTGREYILDDDFATLSIDLQNAFDFDLPPYEVNPPVEELVSDLGVILPYHPQDEIDRVFGIEYLGSTGSTGVVYPQFQRYLNSDSISDEALKQGALAMAIPFGQEIIHKVEKDFQILRQGGGVLADGYSSRICINEDKFGLYKVESDEDKQMEWSGTVKWRWLDISTLGSCACWGAAGQERETGVRDSRGSARLYEMSPHNVDNAIQTLSLILGVGALAHHAAMLEDSGDLFASAEWGEPRVYYR